jgi:hypothetical protein
MTTGGFVGASSSSFLSLILLMRHAKNQKIELQHRGEREWLPEKSVKSWYQYNWGVYGEKAFTSNTQRALQTSACSSCCSESKLSMCRKVCAALQVCAVPEIKLTGNLNVFDFKFMGLTGVKACILKPQIFFLWIPHKEHTESANRLEHLAPCRFKFWTNLYSIGIRQPLAQLTSCYKGEISRVSLHVGRLKWDFRTDSPGQSIEQNHTKALSGLFTAAAWQHPCLHAWALARVACWGIQLLLVSFTRLAAIIIRCLLTSSPSPSPQCSASCELEWACEGLGLQVGASMMNCKIFKQSCQVQRFYQRDETKRWSGLKSSSAIGTLTMRKWLQCWGYDCKIFKQSCKVQRFHQREINQKSWSVQMVIGTVTMSCDWNVEDVTANNSSNPAKKKD